jgi:hypothetical protein
MQKISFGEGQIKDPIPAHSGIGLKSRKALGAEMATK